MFMGYFKWSYGVKCRFLWLDVYVSVWKYPLKLCIKLSLSVVEFSWVCYYVSNYTYSVR